MKNYCLVMLSLALIAGCVQEQQEAAVTNEVAPETAETSETTESNQGFYEKERIIEFMLCDEGSDYTDESMRALIDDWNEAIDGSENRMLASYGLRPKYDTDMFDGIWTLVWPDMETRDAGWEAWPDNGGNALREKYETVLTCQSETTYLYSGHTIAAPTSIWEGEPHFVSYHFCSFNEGVVGEDVQPVETKIAGWIEQYRQTNADDGMALNGLTPLFDSRNPDDEIDDFDGVGMWGYRSVDDANKFAEAWAESDIQAEIDKVVSCEEYDFDMYIFRLPEA